MNLKEMTTLMKSIIKKNSFILLLGLVPILNACFKGEKVDLIIHNALIITMDENLPKSEAMAIKDGKIIAIGSEREILNRFRASEEINAKNKTIIPGINDGHGHILSLAKQKMIVDLTGTQSYQEMIERLTDYKNKHQVDFLVGRGWDQSLWGDSLLPDNELLNLSFPEIPVALTRIDGHAMLVNQKMLDLANINNKTNIAGGKVELKDNKPTGILLDMALEEVKKHFPTLDKSILKKHILQIQEDLFSLGITKVHEAGLTYDDFLLLDEMVNESSLELEIYGMLFPEKENLALLMDGHYKNENLIVKSIKVILDGALGSKGACLVEHYENDPHNNGILLFDKDSLVNIAKFAKLNNVQLNIHCIGDSANRIVLKMVDTLMQDIPDHRWRIEHAQIVSPKDFQYFDKTGLIPSVQPTHATSDQKWVEDRIGAHRLEGAYAYKTLFDIRKLLIFGTDFPIEHFDPFATIHAAVQRKNINNEPIDGFLKEQAIDLNSSLKAMTIWAAYGAFDEAETGSLTKGKKANFTILDQPLESYPNFSPNYALKTFINGKIVYDIDL